MRLKPSMLLEGRQGEDESSVSENFCHSVGPIFGIDMRQFNQICSTWLVDNDTTIIMEMMLMTIKKNIKKLLTFHCPFFNEEFPMLTLLKRVALDASPGLLVASRLSLSLHFENPAAALFSVRTCLAAWKRIQMNKTPAWLWKLLTEAAEHFEMQRNSMSRKLS